MRQHDRDTFDLFVMRFDEADVPLEGGNILPAAKSGSVDQQSDPTALFYEGFDLRRDLPKVVSFQSLGNRQPQEGATVLISIT